MSGLAIKKTINNIFITKIIVLCAAFLIIFMLLRLITAKDYYLINQDETLYLTGAQAFAKTNSPKARIIIAENVSPILEADWYGLPYPIIYGGVMKIIGNTAKHYVYISLTFLLILTILVFKDKNLKTNIKYGLVAAIVASPLLVYFSFFIMPTTLNILITYLMILMIVKLNSCFQENDTKKFNMFVLFFILSIIGFSFIKVTFVFWVFALIVFSRNFKQFFVFSILCTLSVVVASVYMKLFNAPAYAYNISNISNVYTFNLKYFIQSSIMTCYQNILKIITQFRRTPIIFLFPYFFIIISPFFFAYKYFRNRNLILLGIAIVCLVSNFISFFFYYLEVGNFLRLSVPLFFGLCYMVICDNKLSDKLKISFLFLLFANTILVYIDSYKSFKERSEIVSVLKQEQFSSFGIIPKLIEKKEITTILVNRNLIVKNPIAFLLSVPYVSTENKLIRYTSNMREDNPLFLHQKLKIDYIINDTSINGDSLRFVYSNKYFYLYKLAAPNDHN